MIVEGIYAKHNARLSSLDLTLSLNQLKSLTGKLKNKKFPLKIRHLTIKIEKAKAVSKIDNAYSEGSDSEGHSEISLGGHDEDVSYLFLVECTH